MAHRDDIDTGQGYLMILIWKAPAQMTTLGKHRIYAGCAQRQHTRRQDLAQLRGHCGYEPQTSQGASDDTTRKMSSLRIFSFSHIPYISNSGGTYAGHHLSHLRAFALGTGTCEPAQRHTVVVMQHKHAAVVRPQVVDLFVVEVLPQVSAEKLDQVQRLRLARGLVLGFRKWRSVSRQSVLNDDKWETLASR